MSDHKYSPAAKGKFDAFATLKLVELEDLLRGKVLGFGLDEEAMSRVMPQINELLRMIWRGGMEMRSASGAAAIGAPAIRPPERPTPVHCESRNVRDAFCRFKLLASALHLRMERGGMGTSRLRAVQAEVDELYAAPRSGVRGDKDGECPGEADRRERRLNTSKAMKESWRRRKAQRANPGGSPDAEA